MDRTNQLELALRAVAIAQLGIALLNLSLVRIMKWQPELERLSLLTSEVFRVHVIFISLAVATFGLLTWRFASELAYGGDPIARWLTAAIGTFWAARSVIQWTHYSHTHWRGLRVRTMLHWLLFLGYGSFGLVYLAAAFLTR